MTDLSESYNTICVLLVEDNNLVRLGFRTFVACQTSIKLVGEAATYPDAMALARQEKPDIILLNYILAEQSTVDRIPELLALSDTIRILIFTGSRDLDEFRRSDEFGASGIVYHNDSRQTLFKAIHRVHAGELWIDRSMTANILREYQMKEKRHYQGLDTPAGSSSSLTRREREIAILVTKAYSTKEIAKKLIISEKTVRNQLVTIYEKLGISSRVELAVMGTKHHWTRI